MLFRDWGLRNSGSLEGIGGNGDWGLGTGDWGSLEEIRGNGDWEEF